MAAALPKRAEAPEVSPAAPASNPQPRKLLVGLFVDTPLQPRWVAEAFAKVARSEFAEIVVIAAAGDARAPDPLLWRLYGGIDRWAFARGEDPGERIDIAAAVPHKKNIQLRS